MADIITSPPPSPAHSQGLAAESQETAETLAAMAPRRRVRATASPSPAPQGPRASTPARDSVTGRAIADRAGVTRTPVTAKYSTSYGSPMTQLPDRATVGGGGNIKKAAAEIFTKVKKDNVAAEARRRIKDQARAARAGSRNGTASPPPRAIRPTVELEEPESDEQETSGEEGSEYEDQAESHQTTRRAPRKPAPKDIRKRVRDDEEEEARAEKERKERDARLRRERSEEARLAEEGRRAEVERKAELERKAAEKERKVAEKQRKAEQQRLAEQERKAAEQERKATEKAEKERKAEQQRQAEHERLAQQAAREEAARAAMPPPPQPPAPRPAPEVTSTPDKAATPTDLTGHRPGSARSFVEEGNLFHTANVKTPTPPPPKNVRWPGPPAPAAPPQPAQPPAGRTRSSAAPPPEPASPPSVLKRPPRRPGTTPASRAATKQASPELPGLDDEDQLPQSSPSDPYTAATYVHRLRSRLKELNQSKVDTEVDTGEAPPETPPAFAPEGHRSRWANIKPSFSPWSILKAIAGAFIMMHAIRMVHGLIRPDLFETPVLALRWYGWNDWANNAGQFFPSPLLHPLGVLTNDQYDDLKDYLQRRTTTTEAAVDNLKSVLPKVVSVRKDKKGKIIIADEFWAALKDKIQHDSRILSLDEKSRVSDKHWKAIEQRLKDAGLLGKPLSADDVERIVDKAAPASWEKWLQKNKQKVADTIGQGKGSPKSPSRGSDETTVSQDEFMRELTDRLAKSKKEVDTEMGGLRKELDGVLREVKKLASEGGMTKAETTSLINKVVDTEITRRLARIGGSKSGTVASIDAAFRNRVNLFSPGNNAVVDITKSSPTYKFTVPLVGTKEYLKAMRAQPQFMQDKSQALQRWTDPGHCWCAGTQGGGGDSNRTIPAVLAVRLPRFVVPQHILLEHIDPAATTDPLAMPRDVEVWAMFDEHARRERVLDWMAAQFPRDMGRGTSGDRDRDAANGKLIDEGWAKIGQFAYEHRPHDEGVYVHQLSRDLVERLGAATDFVMVRAVTNYGAKDHTCFYRVRMYGDVAEDLDSERASREW
ncbi:hypothetical protein C8A01DRAFT_18580 [Parachaetomium inaequale]|uniref:SUN domain-containing protein n=1 Tax=Parachaetomium inaequale TaxID=2588326 RepID=A0AAN6SPB7_9PEZI|nr:hypothetical protein C8A01DRAFT_18580 [Parachaetomium inaequale]